MDTEISPIYLELSSYGETKRVLRPKQLQSLTCLCHKLIPLLGEPMDHISILGRHVECLRPSWSAYCLPMEYCVCKNWQ